MNHDEHIGSRRAPDPPEILDRFHAKLELVQAEASRLGAIFEGLVEHDELLSAGHQGLLNAARRFDVSRNVPFHVYAQFRVRGAMLDAARQSAGFTRPPRKRTRQDARDLRVRDFEPNRVRNWSSVTANSDEEQELDDHLAELATASALALAAEAAHRASLLEERTTEDPEAELIRAELLFVVEGILREMPPREALLVRLHHLEGEPLDRIALSCGIDKSWASRLHKRAMARLTRGLRSRT